MVYNISVSKPAHKEKDMDEKRQGEIALKVVKQKLFKSGLPGDGSQRELGNIAKELGIELEELKQFYEAILPEFLGRILGRKKVSLTTSD
jgi:hypothetical protein